MAISKVQDAVYAIESDNSVTCSFPNTPAQGNLLIAWAASGDTTIDSASISGFTKAVSVLQGSTATNSIWYKVAGAAESKDVTLNWTGSTTTRLAIEEWTDVDTLDQVASTATTGSTVTSRSSGTTPTTTRAAELCVALVGIGNTVTSLSWSNSFSAEFTQIVFNGATRVVSATGAYETTLSWTTARVAGGCIATFYKASGGGARYIMLLRG